METITEKGLRHWGSYDGVDHGFESRAMSPISRSSYVYPYEQLRGPGIDPAEPVAMDPGLPTVDWAALLAPEVRGALQYVRSELQPSVMQALRATAWHSFGGGADTGIVDHGTVAPYLSTTGMGWADDAVAAGNAILADLSSLGPAKSWPNLPPGSAPGPVFDIVRQPEVIASMARVGGPSAIVAIPPGLDNLAQQATFKLNLPTPPGLPTQPSTGFPWKPVVLVGGGLVLVAGIYVAATRNKR